MNDKRLWLVKAFLARTSCGAFANKIPSTNLFRVNRWGRGDVHLNGLLS